ncbi:unnamed protein product [Rotaria sp. Silwood1]|nr:unnamed protein product [Rotaria sp. Silwood1]CAF0740767.1 unnamed protein product [Rotaria sp. Silwood1]CAF3349820.1 unnamed protein product [Rotaria sp. Silwood1]
MKDVFGSVPLVASGHPSSSVSNNTNDCGVCSITTSTDVNTTPRPFITIQNDQRASTHDEKVVRSECIRAMATSQLGFSYNSSQFLPEIFWYMFSDSSIAADYSLRPRKLSYVISHGTSYYFTSELIKNIRKAHGFSLLFDESTIAGVRRQLDIFFLYWAETKNGCFQPSMRKDESSRASIMYLARNVPHLLTSEEVDRVGAEWRIYEMADILDEWIKKSTNSSNNIIEYVPIDEYWYQVLSTAI